jgi:hypothetical protein
MRTSATILGAILLTIPAWAFAQQPGLAEMRIAKQHAASAANASDLQRVKVELQQALNCLVGREGGEFRSKAGDPCNGASALRKLPSNSVNRIRVQKAARLATVGVTFHDFKPAHFTAQAVQAVLEEGVK